MTSPDVSGGNHTLKHFDEELQELHGLLVAMGDSVLRQARAALQSLAKGDVETAQAVIAQEQGIDEMEVAIDSKVFAVMARRSPVANDLRLVVVISKGISDLERIGDEAVRIAGLVLHMCESTAIDASHPLLHDVERMGALALERLEETIGILERWNAAEATSSRDHLRELENEFKSCVRRLMTFVMQDVRNIGFVVSVISIIKSLERIGHDAIKLNEYVIFQARGVDVRAESAPDRSGTD